MKMKIFGPPLSMCFCADLMLSIACCSLVVLHFEDSADAFQDGVDVFYRAAGSLALNLPAFHTVGNTIHACSASPPFCAQYHFDANGRFEMPELRSS